jgi:hypothetical protein
MTRSRVKLWYCTLERTIDEQADLFLDQLQPRAVSDVVKDLLMSEGRVKEGPAAVDRGKGCRGLIALMTPEADSFRTSTNALCFLSLLLLWCILLCSAVVDLSSRHLGMRHFSFPISGSKSSFDL